MPRLQFATVFQHIRWLVGADALSGRADSQLLARFSASRDEEAFVALLQRHGPLVLNACRRVLGNVHDADDAFQATFLVLARKAGSIRQRESVASWLYGVAYRIASKAKTAAARRTAHERQAVGMATAQSDPALWEGLRPILDEELSRLPEKYRVAVVLRYLQGKSTEEAAREAGCPAGTMKWRLAQALEMLRQRLARHGATIPGCGLAVLLAEHGASAAMPAALAESTLKAALLFAAPETATAGTISLSIAAMVEGALKTMWIGKLTMMALVFTVVGLAGTGLGVLAFQTLGHEAAAVPAPEKPPQPAAQQPEGGKPVNGLKLTLSADKTETVMKADGSNAESVKLKLTFANVSDKPIKLDAYDLPWRCLRFGATGPDGAISGKALDIINRRPARPVPADFPVIAPGKMWHYPDEMEFPGGFKEGSSDNAFYAAPKPGEYRLKFLYAGGHVEYRGVKDAAGDGSWTGTLTSNELVLTVKPAGGAAGPKGEPPEKADEKVASYLGTDGATRQRLAELMSKHGITSVAYGSLGYTMSVPLSQAAKAREILAKAIKDGGLRATVVPAKK